MIDQLRELSMFKKWRYSTRRLEKESQLRRFFNLIFFDIISKKVLFNDCPPGEEAEVDDGEDEVEAEELCVVPHVRERELAGHGGTEVLGIFNFSIIEKKQLAG